jgi:predicted amidohydrolase YtcJ
MRSPGHWRPANLPPLLPAAIFALLLTGMLTGCDPDSQPGSQNAAAQAADHIFWGGLVWTGNPAQATPEALAVRGERIVYLGDRDGAAALAGPDTVIHELRNGMLLPGFIDAHAHIMAGGYTLGICDLQDRRDAIKLRALLEECARNRDYGPDEWVEGGRWPMSPFENGSPPMEWLDVVFEGRPAYFVDSFGHNAWVSSRALGIAGITADTPDPPGGKIERFADGRPNGTLREKAMQLVAEHIPPASPARLAENLQRGLAEAARFGITAFIEPGVDADEARVYQQADRDGVLSARVLASLSPNSESAMRFGDDLWALLELREALESPRFRTHSVKVYIDGVIESKTSFMLQPYTDGSNFEPFYPADELAGLYARLDAMGLQVHTHAIGDAAIRHALDAYQAMRAANGPSDNRHQIVHLQLIDPADIPRFGELDVAASFQGLWAYPDEYIDMAIPVVGEERVRRFYPIASIQRTGGTLLGGSDWDVSSLNPLDAIETMVRRQDPGAEDGPELGSGERVDVETALAMYTRNAARAMKLESEVGTLEVGKRADLVVLDRNLLAIPQTEINQAVVQLTVMDGQIIHRGEAPR